MILNDEEKALLANLNYDLNIWDRSEGEGEPDWTIALHNLEYATDGHIQTGDWLEGMNIDLTDDEARALTLGWGEDLGGDYTEDSDFFLDIDAFFTVYKDIPERVKNELLALPPIDIQSNGW